MKQENIRNFSQCKYPSAKEDPREKTVEDQAHLLTGNMKLKKIKQVSKKNTGKCHIFI